MPIVQKIEMISTGNVEQIELISANDDISDLGELLIFSIESDGGILSSVDLMKTDNDNWFDYQSASSKRSALRSYFVKVRGAAQRFVTFSAEIGVKIKIRILRIASEIHEFTKIHSCDICKKIVTAIMRHAMASVGIVTFEGLEAEIAAEFSDAVLGCLERILKEIQAPELFNNIIQHIGGFFRNAVQQVVKIEDRCSTYVCEAAEQCP